LTFIYFVAVTCIFGIFLNSFGKILCFYSFSLSCVYLNAS
uniref:Uncharacterized protein n=1 Tax=Aegilops tauschii subsp. strangulata TaxID=200361 RepID=A0A452ZXA5_AEGTS